MPRKTHLSYDEVTRLEDIPNIGPSIAADLRRIGIQQPSDLAGQEPFALYTQLCEHDRQAHDLCVLDVFMAAVDFMGGTPSRPWWKYTSQRKREMTLRKLSKPSFSKKLGRRALLVNGALALLATKTMQASAAHYPLEEKDRLRFSMLTDLHYADKPPGGTRFYRETLAKVDATRPAISAFQPQFVVELGDVIDAAETVEQEKQYLKTIHQQLATLPGDKHYVLGNHCVYWLTKPEFLEVVGQKKSFYSFDVQRFHLIVLDACFRSDGEPYGRKNFEWTDSHITQDELKWLAADLKSSQRPTIVFIHQRLDVAGNYGVKNAPQVRQILEASGNVLAVFQGHNHKNDYNEIGGIHYCTLSAMVEGSGEKNNAFSNVSVDERNNIRVHGFFLQQSYDWT